MVLEHILEPDRLLDEVHRVLTDDGMFVCTPNLYHWATWAVACTSDVIKSPLSRVFDGRSGEDVFRFSYRINSGKVACRLAERHGFKVDGVHLVSSSGALATLCPVAVLELAYIRACDVPPAPVFVPT